MNRNYSVFLSHAGPDKESIAIPLYERLREKGIHAFLDREELHVGDNGPRVMEYAMNTAPVGVFILSPEFAARNWTMAELMCFQKREREALEGDRPLPILIPVFYRLDIATCRNETNLFRAKNENGENAFVAETFFERAAGDKISVAQVARAMKQVTMRTGIENRISVTNGINADMQCLRSAFIKRIVDEIESAVVKTKTSGAEDDPIRYWRAVEHAADRSIAGASGTTMASEVKQDSYALHFEVWQNPSYVYLPTQQSIDPEGSGYSGVSARDIILQEKLDGPAPVIAIQGMPGIGKTCTLRALCHDQNVRDKFSDGVFVIRLGANAVLQTFIAGLSSAVAASGGSRLASDIGQSKSLDSATTAAMKWFAQRTCLFLLDDVWSKPENGTAYLEALSRICAGGKYCALVFSTREKQLLSHKSVTHDVRLLAHEPRGNFSRSVLLRTAIGNAGPTLDSSTDALVNLLLDACCGLPVALTVTGRSIFKIAIDMSRDYERAISLYYNLLSKSRSVIIDQCADDEYLSLKTALDTSINILDSTRSEDDNERSSYICAEMHRSLCVLKKQQWVSIYMLRRLWNTASDEDATFFAEKLSEVGLVDVHFRKIGENEVKGIQLHDLVHDVATWNAVKAKEERAWHARLLRTYASVDGIILQMEGGCREWWKAKGAVDNYVDGNVVRHLIAAGHVREAVLLVTRPQWIARQLQSRGILSFERDVDLLTKALETFTDAVTDPEDTVEGLRLVRNCIRAGLSAILDTPREVYFQITTRMVFAKETSSFAMRIVQYAERHVVKPCLKTVSACAQQAESVGGKRFPCSNARCVSVVENEGIVIAGCVGGEIAIFDMETCIRKAAWRAHEKDVKYLGVATDGELLLSGCDDNTVKVWDLTNNFVQVADCQLPHWVRCIDVTPPDNQQCVFGKYDGIISVWELKTGLCVMPELGSHKPGVSSVAMSPDRQLVASGDPSGVIRLWSMIDGPGIHSVHSSRTEEMSRLLS